MIRKLVFLASAILILTPVLALAQAAGTAAPAPAAQAPTATPPAAGIPAAPDLGKGIKDNMKAQMHAAGKCPCPYCPAKDDEAANSKDAHGQQMRMMMNARLAKDDPGAILGMRDDLKLTPEQAKQLEQLQAENRQKVEGILTAEQKTELAKLPAEATSMREMHQQMASKMKADKPAEAEPGAIDKPKEDTAARDASKEIMNK